jgi:RimJ/RimL family protein N-acetyltransferase
MFPERIETDRLELTALTSETVDVLDYYDICSGNATEDIEVVTEYLPWESHDTPKETEEFLDGLTQRREAGENAEYAVRPKETDDEAADDDRAGEIAGAVGLSPHWDRRTGELGIWLRRPYWGRGYSGERAAALMAVAFERLDLEVVAVSHHAGNDKSRRAIEKYVERFGGQHEGLLRNGAPGPDGPVDLHRYTVTREEWADATGRD